MQVREARWPALGRVELEGVEWSEAGTMLLAVEKLRLDLALGPLRHGDVDIEQLAVLGLRLDLPAVQRHMKERPTAPGGGGKRSFPRPGSVAGVPSVGIESLEIEAPWLRLRAGEPGTDDGARSLVLRAALNFRHGVVPRLQVESARSIGAPESWSLDSLALDLDLARGTASGRGRGHVGPNWPLHFALDPDGADRFVLRLSEGEREGPPQRMGLVARAQVERRGLAVDSLGFTATLRTPGSAELARIPALEQRLHGKPDFGGALFETRGTLAFSPRALVRLDLVCLPGDLLTAGSMHFEGGGGSWEVRCDSLQAVDLHLRGRLRSDPDSLAVAAHLDVLGPGWRDWLTSSRIPEVSLRSRLDFVRRRQETAARFRLSASGSIAAHAVDRLLLEGRLGLRPEAASALQIQVASYGAEAGLAVEIRRGDTLHARLSPLVVETTRVAAGKLNAGDEKAATLVYVPKSRSFSLAGFQIRGAAGNLDLEASYSPPGEGSFQAQLAWPHFPVLLARLARLAPARAESLQAHWREEGPYRLQCAGEVRAGSTASTGTFALPGPRALAALWPALRCCDPGALAGTFHWRTASGGRFDVELDGGESAWLDSLHVAIGGTRESLQVRAARLQMHALHLAVDGGMQGETLALQGRWTLQGSTLLERFVHLEGDSIQKLEMRGRAQLSGARSAPALAAELEGSFAGLGLQVPAIRAEVHRDEAGILGRLLLPSGGKSRWIALDHLDARVSSSQPQRWRPERVALHARGPGFELKQAARLGSEKLSQVEVDTLAFVLAGKDLRALHPFRFSLAAGRLALQDLELAGALGRLQAHGAAGPDSTRFALHLHLALPDEPPALSIPPTFWPRGIRFNLRATALDSLTATGEIQGLKLAGGTEPTLRFRLDSASGLARVAVQLGDSTSSSLEGHATLPSRLQLYPPQAALLSGPVAADFRFDALPFGVHTSRKRGLFGPEDLGRLGGRIVLGGTTAALAGFAAVEGGFPQSAKLSSYVLTLRARAGQDAAVDSLWNAAPPTLDVAPQAPEDFLAGFALRSGNQGLVRGSAAVPLLFSLQRPFVRAAPARSLMVRVDSESVPLAALNPFLPRGAALDGAARLVLALDGEVQNPRLEGTLRTNEVELTLGDGSRLVFVTNAELGGERLHPELRGDIEVKTGLVKVPEAERHLHPKEGEALLLGAAATDTLLPAPAPPPPEQTPPALQRRLAATTLDLRIRVPKAFFVRGRGLDIEGAGELQVTQKEGEPVVAGQLRGIRGTYSIAGRNLNLDRGSVTFSGNAKPDPALDIQMSTSISGIKIRVLVTGTAEKPLLVLSSDPEMKQTDIIALLALGKTYDQLSDEESNVMRERATAILVSMGATALQENVTKEFGIDVVQYKSSTGAPGATSEEQSKAGSLAFGKYLSPKVLLSYSYSLDRAVDDVVSLEYFLKGQLTVETLYSVKGQSGLGFGWAMEY